MLFVSRSTTPVTLKHRADTTFDKNKFESVSLAFDGKNKEELAADAREFELLAPSIPTMTITPPCFLIEFAAEMISSFGSPPVSNKTIGKAVALCRFCRYFHATLIALPVLINDESLNKDSESNVSLRIDQLFVRFDSIDAF